jgi:hypothetical protein
MRAGWIVIPNWGEFQHYRDRDPTWIKTYVRLLHDDDYLRLTAHQRAVLHGVWLAYASSNGQLRASTSSLTRQLALRVASRQLDALTDAGFIEISASRPLSLARSREAEAERDNPLPPSQSAKGDQLNGSKPHRPTAKELRRYTGCRATRGSHGAGFAHDPLGMDKPPKDWPHPKPTRRDVELALEIADR